MADRPRPTQAQREFAEGLFRDHGSRLRRIARRHSLNADDADEAIQRTMEIAMLRGDPEMPGAPLAWATTVLKHEAWQIKRQRLHRIQHPIPGQAAQDPLERLEAPQPGPVDAAERAERTRAIRRAFDALKPQERQVLLLLGAGHTYKEIERETGFTHTKINRCIAEGRTALRERMAAWEQRGRDALDDIYNLRGIGREPTAVLLRRRRELIDARRAAARAADAADHQELSLRRRRRRLEHAKARRLAFESDPKTSRSEIARARAAERDARQALKQLGGGRGAEAVRQTNSEKRERTIAAIDEELARRREAVLRDAVQNQPAYVVGALGPRPDHPRDRPRWCNAVDRLVAIRQLHGITDPEQPLGSNPCDEAKAAVGRLRRALGVDHAPKSIAAQRPGPEMAL